MNLQQLEYTNYAEMLHQLKSTVEGILDCQSTNVWDVYGGLNRLHSIISKIFKHGFRIYKQNGEADCWIFIQGLSWLQPTLAASPSFVGNHGSHLKSPIRNYDKAMTWIYKSIENHTLSDKLCWLLSDQEHLVSCYNPTAYLRQARYSEATLICLRAVEQNQPGFLIDIDPTLYLRKPIVGNKAHHRRSQSYPERKMNDVTQSVKTNDCLPNETNRLSNNSSSVHRDTKNHHQTSPTSIPTATNIATSSSSSSSTSSNRADNVDDGDSYKILNLVILESIFKPTQREMEAKRYIKRQLLKRNYTTMDLSYIRQLEHGRGRRTRKRERLFVDVCDKKHYRSLITLHPGGILSNRIGTSCVLDDDILKVDYTRCGVSPSCRKDVDWAAATRNDSVDSLLSECSVNTLLADNEAVCRKDNNGKNGDKDKSNDTSNNCKRRRRTRRRSSIFRLPFRIFESSDNDDDDDTSVCSDGSKTLVPTNNGDSVHTATVTSATVAIPKRKSFIEHNGNIPLPMSIGFFPRPSPGQSLISFLSSGVFTHATAELDRENAHFNISEAMIATIEQVKCNHHLSNADEMLEESDEEINVLKRTIRMRRRQKQQEEQIYSDSAFFSSETNDTMTTDPSVNSLSSSVYSTTSEGISTDTEYEDTNEDIRNLLTAKKSGLSVSKLSIYSNQSACSQNKNDVSTSAENVAISLLRRFNENQLPAASEIEWLVSENDAPQKILPLPSGVTIFSDEFSENNHTLLRGTSDWAPPRPQIIFTPHPPPVRKILMEKQRYRCAGCSMKVAQKYACKFRYCEYLGRYFCTDCHARKTAIIPGRVLSKWDFSRCPVSNFSYKLLDQMSTDPLFNISDLNPSLYEKNKNLKKIRLYRFQLMYLKDFVFTCRYAESLKELLKKEQSHILSEPDCYSLHDLVQVKNGKLLNSLSDMIKYSLIHVNDCQFCQMRGFICELCNNCKVIFPWDLERVHRCNKCGSCYHANCFSKIRICPKCLRRSNRRDRWNCMSIDDVS